MNCVFTNSDITGYIDGTILRVAPEQDGIGARNWVKNDSWAQQVIMDNVSTTQMNHICSKRTVHAMYEGLASTHEDMVFYTVNNIENLLQTAKATDSNNLLKHLDTLKGLRDRITRVFCEVPCTSSITQGPSASLFGFHHTSVLV
jgi:hypothetical protein